MIVRVILVAAAHQILAVGANLDPGIKFAPDSSLGGGRIRTSNEVVLIGNELFPTWSGEGTAQPPVLRPRLVIRLSPQSAKDLGDVLQNFVTNYERAYGELRTDYLLRK